MAGEVTLRTTLARPYLATAATPQVAYVLLEALPGQAVAQVRVPVNVGFVLDRSGSMKGDKIDRMRRAVSQAIETLDPQDTVSIIIFDHRVDVLVAATSAANRAELQERVRSIRDAGGTKIAPAVDRGLREIERGGGGARRMVLLTDGQTEQERECLLRADDCGARGVPITALGVGNDWNEDLLEEMGRRSGGSADYIDRPDQIVNYFQRAVRQAQASAIENTTLTLRLVQGVTPRAIWQVVPLISNLGYQPVSDRDVSVNLGTLETNAPRALLLELLVDPRPAGQYRIGQAELRYDVTALGARGETSRTDLALTFSDDATLTGQVAPQVMNIVEKVSAFKLQTRALQDVQAGNIQGATQKLQNAVTRLLSQGEVDLANTMQQEINNLQQNGQLSSEGQKTMKFGTRKTVRLTDLGEGGGS